MKLILLFLVTVLSEFSCEEIFENRVYNGGIVSADHVPYLARITIPGNEEFFCSGSLISHHYVLTAAHCIEQGTDTFEIRLGIDTVYQSGFSETCHQCWTTHPGYVSTNYFWEKHDIALMRLEKHVEFTDRIRPILLPSYIDVEKNLPNKRGTVVGWGLTNIFGGERTATWFPLAANAVVEDQEKCKELFFAAGLLYEPVNHFCTNSSETGACPGDSGGPFIIDGKQFGIVKGGTIKNSTCHSSYGGSYTNVVNFLRWIKENSDVIIGRYENPFPTDWH